MDHDASLPSWQSDWVTYRCKRIRPTISVAINNSLMALFVSLGRQGDLLCLGSLQNSVL